MRLPASRRTASLIAIGVALALVLIALGLRAAMADDDLQVLSRAEPDPDVRERILGFEAAGERAPRDIEVYLAPGGRRVYLLRAPCCDIFDRLYDEEGRHICAPSGGFLGQGDGNCPAWIHVMQRRQPIELHPRPSASAGMPADRQLAP